jgi:hypothetical protein
MTFQLDAFQQAAFQGLYTPPVIRGITDTYLFDPDLAECLEDAFERAGMSVQGVSQEHLSSALRSCKFLLNSEWSTLGIRQWQIEQVTFTGATLPVNATSVTLPAGTVDVFQAVLRRNGADVPMYPISRTDYAAITTKSRAGRPNQYFVDKRYNQTVLYLWNAVEFPTDILFVDCFRQVADAGEMFNTLQMPAVAQDCFVTGLAMRLAQKFNRDRYDELRIEYGGPMYPERYGGKLFQMRAETGERADVVLRVPRGRFRS